MSRGGEPLRILVAHNRYRRAGGEDAVFANEVTLLRSAGQVVETLEVANDGIAGAIGKVSTALGAVHNVRGRGLVVDAIRRFRPDVLHVHNFFPRISPSLFDACRQEGVPVVWTLHNYRVACANGLLYRDGKPCEDCLGKAPVPALVHRCYRGSLAGSAAIAAMIGWHRWRGTWRTKVTRFIALSEFGRDIAIRAGLPADKVAIKPNFVSAPAPQGSVPAERKGALFVGRLSAEKGVRTMIAAWKELPDIPLTVIGDGPEREMLERLAPANVSFEGHRPRDVVSRAMAGSRALVLPSEWYENFPMALVEAMAVGTPVIASRIGTLKTLVKDGCNGLHFAPGDAADLARTVRSAFADPSLLETFGQAAREEWQARMSPEGNLEHLLAIYREAMAA